MSRLDHAQSDEPNGNLGLPLLYNVSYCSRSAIGVDNAVVAGIIGVSQRNNSRQGITGLLVFGSGVFFQWLEGPRDNVTALMNTLSKDSRHDTIVTLDESEEVRERVFADWDMELVTEADIRDVLNDALDTVKDAQSAKALHRLLAQLDINQVPGSG